jgi:hypothetical protein
MCFLWGTEKPIELSWVELSWAELLSKRWIMSRIVIVIWCSRSSCYRLWWSPDWTLNGVILKGLKKEADMIREPDIYATDKTALRRSFLFHGKDPGLFLFRIHSQTINLTDKWYDYLKMGPALARPLPSQNTTEWDSNPRFVLQRYNTVHTLGRVVSATGHCEVIRCKTKFLLIFVSVHNWILD